MRYKQQNQKSPKSTFKGLFTRGNMYGNCFGSKSPLYAFTNEEPSAYMSDFDFKGKSVLASIGSGDFILNAYLSGANEIDGFDVNLYTKYYYLLKKAIIKSYDYEKASQFIKNPTLIYEKFNEYSINLDEETKFFIQDFFNKYGKCADVLAKKLFFECIVGENCDEWTDFKDYNELFNYAQYRNLYLSNEKLYNDLKQKLNDVPKENFYIRNISKLKINKQYDIIYLSNICDHMLTERAKKLLNYLMKNNLKENGEIIYINIDKRKELNAGIGSRSIFDAKSAKVHPHLLRQTLHTFRKDTNRSFENIANKTI